MRQKKDMTAKQSQMTKVETRNLSEGMGPLCLRVLLVVEEEKLVVVYNLLKQDDGGRVLIFANRRSTSRRLMETLRDYDIPCALLTGDVEQGKAGRFCAHAALRAPAQASRGRTRWRPSTGP